jgi:hypothetical protein
MIHFIIVQVLVCFFYGTANSNQICLNPLIRRMRQNYHLELFCWPLLNEIWQTRCRRKEEFRLRHYVAWFASAQKKHKKEKFLRCKQS